MHENQVPLLTVIERSSRTLQAAADELSSRIELFDAWLAALPGHIEANCELPDGGALRFLRSQGKWRLEAHGAASPEWRPLAQCSLLLKVAALSAFPALLRAMSPTQDALTEQLRKSVREFDEWYGTLPQPQLGVETWLDRKT